MAGNAAAGHFFLLPLFTSPSVPPFPSSPPLLPLPLHPQEQPSATATCDHHHQRHMRTSKKEPRKKESERLAERTVIAT